MWFIWIMWVIVALAIIATIILLTGKGSMLVSGFNTKSPEERAKYDKKKVSKQAGSIMVFVDIGLLALTSYIHFRAIPAIQNNTISDYGTEITIVALGICVYINMNHQRDRNTGSFIGYTGSISVPVVFRYDNSFYSKMIQ